VTHPDTALVNVNGRWPLFLPRHRALRPEWPWWEATRLAAMHHVIRLHVESFTRRGLGDQVTRPIVIDVGAEEGDFPALWSSWGADVALAEPNPKVWPNIKLIWEANRLRPPLFCWPGFLGASPQFGTVEWGDTPPWPACADGPVISDHGFCQLGERPDLPTGTIDGLVRALPVWDDATGKLSHHEQTDQCDGMARFPSVITMDVEGSELHVLEGAADTLDRYRPAVFVSVHPEFMAHHYAIADGRQAVLDHMAGHGYEGTYLGTDHEEHWMFLPEGARP
jgi:hypothetical protein